MKKYFSFLLALSFFACHADVCVNCGRETFSGATRCSRCVREKANADAQGAAMGAALTGVFGMIAEESKQEAERERIKKQERAKAIKKNNELIRQQLAVLELNDADEGRHNLGIQLLSVPSTYPLKYLNGVDQEGAYVLSDLPAKLLDVPAKLEVMKKNMPGSLDIMVIRQTSSDKTSGSWKIKNVPCRFFFRSAATLRMELKLLSEDELLFKVTILPENKEAIKVTLVKNTPFDYAHEAGVDGNGIGSRTYTRGLGGTPSKKKTKRKGISW